jgi:hypothetical protein
VPAAWTPGRSNGARPIGNRPVVTRSVVTREALLVSQVHPVKLAADIGASVISIALLWRGNRRAGMIVHYGLPVVGSAAVLAAADLDRLARTPAGRYVREHMPPSAQAVRLAGDALTVWGARRRSRPLIGLGLAVIVVGWCHGLLPRRDVLPRTDRFEP